MFTSSIREHIANLIFPEGNIERRRLEREINMDSLTGLANRRAFDLAKFRAERDNEIVVVLFDANNFGKINKVAGYDIGDRVLRELAECIKNQAKRIGFSERCFRLGGDEFVVLLPKFYADKFRIKVEKAFGIHYFENIPVSVTGSIGSTLIQADSLLQNRKAIQKKEQVS